jgi:GR25 family glycosyltransferase involved in LPS biosynthesis
MSVYDVIDKIFIINLEHRTDRLKHILEQMHDTKIPESKYEIFKAVKIDPGFMGCTQSHLQCLLLAKERQYKNVLILEDDFMVDNKEYFLQSLPKIKDLPMDWDVLFFSVNIEFKIPFTQDFDRIYDGQTTAGYMVNQHYYDTLIDNFRDCFLKKNFVDQHWKSLQPFGNWYSFTPKIGRQILSYSDIEKKLVYYGC